MTARSEARAHLTKAKEFLEAAQTTLDIELLNAATSSAVTAGINSKDAICLALTGRTGKTDNHQEAIRELRDAGPAGRRLESTFQRLLALKPRSQYLSESVSRTDASRAVEWAGKMYAAAADVVTG